MLLIPCPNCGARDESEFDYGGPAIAFPALEASTSDWHQALHAGDATGERIDEHWYHSGGCECWIRISRNSVTHEIDDAASGNEEAGA
jgi:sarcosine oxidase subunit delta